QGPRHARLVDEAAPTLAHAIELDAERVGDGRAGELGRPRPLRAHAPEAAVEVDDAARRRRAVPGEGEVLPQAPLASPGAQPELVAAGNAPSPFQSRLSMIHRLARVEGARRGHRLAWILLELRAGEAQGVLGLGLFQRGNDQAQSRALGILADQLRAPLLAPARAVLAPAVAPAREVAQRQADVAHRRAHADAPLPRAEAAGAARELERGCPRRILGVERDDAPGGVAEQR